MFAPAALLGVHLPWIANTSTEVLQMTMPAEHLRWRRAKRCGSNTCVEVATDGEYFLIRDSKSPETAPLRFTGAEWAVFLAGARAGDFDL
jgi:hypothetical protein